MSKKLGRKSLKTPDRIQKLLELAKQGKSEQEIANIIGVHIDTLALWKRNDVSLLMALKEGKYEADQLVEASLFKRALGMEYYEESSSQNGPIILQKYALPDVRAAQYWLNNRQPKKWRDRVEMVHEAGASLLLNLGSKKKEFPV